MNFQDTTIDVGTPFGTIEVVLKPDALQLLHAERPVTGEVGALIAANRSMLEQVANMKFEAGEVETERSVRITADDLA